MRDLRTTCAELVRGVDDQVASHQKLRDEMTGLGAALDEARQAAHDAEIALASATKDEKKTDEQIGQLEDRLASVNAELADIEHKLAEGNHEQEEAERAAAEGEEILRETEAAAEGAIARAAEWREEVTKQLSVVTEKKIRLARVREQVASTRGTVERLTRSYAELTSRVARLEEDLDDVARQTGETAAELVKTKEMLTGAVVEARD